MSSDNRPGPPVVCAALGDPISIDEYAGGRGLGGASLFAHNRDGVFLRWRGPELATIRPGLRHQLFAVDGGTTETVRDHQLSQLERSGAVPAVVTATTGEPRTAVSVRPRFVSHDSLLTSLGCVTDDNGWIPTSQSTPALRSHDGFEWLYVLSGWMRLVLGDQDDLVLDVGEAAEFDTRVPHWFGGTGQGVAAVLSIFGRPGERPRVRASAAAEAGAAELHPDPHHD